MKSRIKPFFGKLIFGTAFLFILSAANAQTAGVENGAGESAAQVKYLGTQDDMLVFDVAYTNPTGGKFQISIKDQDGAPLYQNIFSEKTIYKQFRLPKSEHDHVVFVIRDFRDADIVKAFDINVNSRIIREVAVRKLN
jgi:hypothetical protein